MSALVSKQNVNLNQQLRHIGSDRMGENESFSMSSHGVVEEESTEEIFSNATTGRPSQPGLGQLFTSGTSWYPDKTKHSLYIPCSDDHPFFLAGHLADLDFGSSSCLAPSPSALSFLMSSTLFM